MFYTAVPAGVASLIGKISSFTLPDKTYMAGGTAVTLYLAHRVSVDIDLFTQKSFLTGPVIDSIKMNHSVRVENLSDRDSLVVNVDGIRFSLFYYPYRLIEPVYNNIDLKVALASLMDIAAMKTVAIVQRGTAKDFVDLKAIIDATGIPLNLLIRATLDKYNMGEDYSYHIRRGLVYFDEAEMEINSVVLLDRGFSQSIMSKKQWEDIRKFFTNLVINNHQ
ncbi:MAG: nucleotidyl transferase AbiEii/AbiGii toxin family protein [Nitrospirota bacterium]